MRYRDLISNKAANSNTEWILSDIKTGRWWPVKNQNDGNLKAFELGLKDYEVYQQEQGLKPAEPKPATLDMLLSKYKKD